MGNIRKHWTDKSPSSRIHNSRDIFYNLYGKDRVCVWELMKLCWKASTQTCTLINYLLTIKVYNFLKRLSIHCVGNMRLSVVQKQKPNFLGIPGRWTLRIGNPRHSWGKLSRSFCNQSTKSDLKLFCLNTFNINFPGWKTGKLLSNLTVQQTRDENEVKQEIYHWDLLTLYIQLFFWAQLSGYFFSITKF